ncbi:hypothetical protein EDD85DRAFT_761205 [Armillaria nabsnona]|nr:hypothetical protein EDD85DRAFT_761205 [Armillaria nabsnona]
MTDTDGLSVLYHTIALACQTLVYGMYAIIMPICSYVMLRRGLRRKSHILLFCMLVFIFSLSTVYWIISLYNDVNLITVHFVHEVSLDDTITTRALRQGMPLMSALVLLNYVLTDGVVVWRAWVLCQDGYSKSLIIPLMFLCLTLLSVLATIGLRIAMAVLNDTQHTVIADKGDLVLDYLQVANLVMSLLTNICSTSVVGIKAWSASSLFLTIIGSDLISRKNITTAQRVFTLLVESGIIYCLSGAMVLIATVIRLPFGTLGDVYTPVNVQFAGIYPTIVILLVTYRGELNETILFASQGQSNAPADVSNLDTIEFGNPHVNSSSGETETFAGVAHNGSMVSHHS